MKIFQTTVYSYFIINSIQLCRNKARWSSNLIFMLHFYQRVLIYEKQTNQLGTQSGVDVQHYNSGTKTLNFSSKNEGKSRCTAPGIKPGTYSSQVQNFNKQPTCATIFNFWFSTIKYITLLRGGLELNPSLTLPFGSSATYS